MKKILIVEDEYITASDIKMKLENLGYEVAAIASSGEEALQATEKSRPDLILMDIKLKGKMSGLETARRIQDLFAIPIVYASAHIDAKRMKEIEATNPIGYLIKPFEDHELDIIVEAALHRHEMQKAVKASQQNFRALIDNSADAMVIVRSDGTHAYANRRAAETVGCSLDELLSTKMKKWIPAHAIDTAMEMMRKRLAGEPISPFFEAPITRKDGSEIMIDISGTRIMWDGVPAVVFIFRDATERTEREKIIRSEKVYFEQLFENSHEAIALTENNGRIKRINQPFTRIFQFSSEDAEGRFLRDLIVPDNDIDEAQTLRKALATGKRVPNESVRKRKDGTLIDVLSLGVPIVVDEKQVGVYVIYSDITERKDAERKLRESEEKYRSLAATEDLMYLVDRNGRYLFANEEYYRRHGLDAKETAEHTYGNLHPIEELKIFQGNITKVFETGNSVTDEYTSINDGRHFIRTFSPVRNDNGDITAVTVVSKDTTEYRRAQEEIDKRRQYLEIILDSSPGAIVVKDMENRIEEWNKGAEKIFGYSREEAIGKCLYNLHTNRDTVEESIGLSERVRNGEHLPPLETVRYRRDKSPVSVILESSPLVINGKLVNTITTYKDITAIKKIADELGIKNECLELTSRFMRHDLTNNMAVIKSAVNLYKRTGKEGLLDEISRRTDMSVALIDRMKDLKTFLDNNNGLRPLNVFRIVENIKTNYPGITFTIEGNISVLADDTLDAVMDNIVSNAAIHGGANEIRIEMRTAGEDCTVSIADNGRGISPEIRERIFDEGFAYGKTGHTGLGLYIVKKAVERYGGTIYAQDNIPKGSLFVLKLKAAALKTPHRRHENV